MKLCTVLDPMYTFPCAYTPNTVRYIDTNSRQVTTPKLNYTVCSSNTRHDLCPNGPSHTVSVKCAHRVMVMPKLRTGLIFLPASLSRETYFQTHPGVCFNNHPDVSQATETDKIIPDSN